MDIIDVLYGFISTSIIALITCLMLLFRRKSTTESSRVTCKEILKILNTEKPIPPDSSSGWTLCAVECGLRVWSRNFGSSLDNNHNNYKATAAQLFLYGCCSRVSTTADVLQNYLRDSLKYPEWDSELKSITVLRNATAGLSSSKQASEDTELSNGDRISAESSFIHSHVVRIINTIAYYFLRRTLIEKIRYIERRWQREENGCTWLLEMSGEEWTFYFAQPSENLISEKTEDSAVLLSVICFCHRARGSQAPLYPARKLSALQQVFDVRGIRYTPCVSITSPNAHVLRPLIISHKPATISDNGDGLKKTEPGTTKVENWLFQRVRTFMDKRDSVVKDKEKDRLPNAANSSRPLRPPSPSDSELERTPELSRRVNKSSAKSNLPASANNVQTTTTTTNSDSEPTVTFAPVKKQKSASIANIEPRLHKSASLSEFDAHFQSAVDKKSLSSNNNGPVPYDDRQQSQSEREQNEQQQQQQFMKELENSENQAPSPMTEKKSFVRFLQTGSFTASKPDDNGPPLMQRSSSVEESTNTNASSPLSQKFSRSRFVMAARKQQTVFHDIFRKLQTTFEQNDTDMDIRQTDVENTGINTPIEQSNVVDTSDTISPETDSNDNIAKPDVLDDFDNVLSPDEIPEEELDEHALISLAEQSYNDIMNEKLRVVNLNIMLPYEQQNANTGGWIYCGLDKDVVILRKIYDDDRQVQSYMGKGLLPAAPKVVFEALRNPRTRFAYDESLKKLDVIHTFEKSGIKIVHSQHEIAQMFKKETRDFCVMCSEKAEGAKYLVAIKSVYWPQCPVAQDVCRGKFLASGWIIEPSMRDNKLYSMVTYIVQLELRTSRDSGSYLLEELAAKQPLCIASLRDYLSPRRVKKTLHHQQSLPLSSIDLKSAAESSGQRLQQMSPARNYADYKKPEQLQFVQLQNSLQQVSYKSQTSLQHHQHVHPYQQMTKQVSQQQQLLLAANSQYSQETVLSKSSPTYQQSVSPTTTVNSSLSSDANLTSALYPPQTQQQLQQNLSGPTKSISHTIPSILQPWDLAQQANDEALSLQLTSQMTALNSDAEHNSCSTVLI